MYQYSLHVASRKEHSNSDQVSQNWEPDIAACNKVSNKRNELRQETCNQSEFRYIFTGTRLCFTLPKIRRNDSIRVHRMFTGRPSCCPASTKALKRSTTDTSSFSSIRDGVSGGVVAFNSISFNAGSNCQANVPSSGRKIAPTSGSIPRATRSIFARWRCVKNVRHNSDEEGSL